MARQDVWDLVLQPRDPIVVRDARPFTADPGARAFTLDWPLPQTVAGALRTHIGNALGFEWRTDGPDRARAIAIRGPFLLAQGGEGARWTVYFPAPADAAIYRHEGERRVLRLRPLAKSEAGGGCDLPHPDLRPVGVTMAMEFKPETEARFWSLEDTAAWLARADHVPKDVLPGLPKESRTHVGINRETQTHEEGALFSTSALAFGESAPKRGDGVRARAMLCRVEDAPAGWELRPGLLALGGERRPAALGPPPASQGLWPEPAVPGRDAIAQASGLRLQLASPALFAHGWRPGWVDEQTLEGAPPGLDGLRLRLVGAAAGRAVAVSGWDLKARGPKATRHAAPAGSVYFFEIAAGTLSEEHFRALWLWPVSDDEQDRRDGFGLALPGVWWRGTSDE